jgi:hypothetical protein
MGRATGSTRVLSAVLVLTLAAFGSIAKSTKPAVVNPLQSQSRFEQAIRDRSSSPFFILLTIVDDRTGVAREACITANLFLGAIHREYGLAYDMASQKRVTEIALSKPDHVFHFSKQEALDNLPSYSEEELVSARKTLDGLDENQVLSTYFQNKAVGCALVERGLSAREGDRGGEIRGMR